MKENAQLAQREVTVAEQANVREMTFERAGALTMYGAIEALKPSSQSDAVEAVAEQANVREMTFDRAESLMMRLTMNGILEGIAPTSWKKKVKKNEHDPKKNEEISKQKKIITDKGVPTKEKPKKWYE
jgi:hypothetical protein